MKTLQLIYIAMLLFVMTCQIKPKMDLLDEWKNEIVETEQAFAKMAKEQSIAAAFIHFAADDAVLMRGNSLVIGKEKIIQHYTPDQPSVDKLSLEWAPDFVDVSTSGDLGYTYGKYIFTKTDSLGKTTKAEGIFHTVWKRQSDGQWRFVWD